MTIEALIIKYLSDANIDGIGRNVYAETPVDLPDNYVLVSRTGGGISNYLRDYAVYTETVSRNDKLTAATLHEAVVEAMLTLPDSTNVYRCRLNSDYDATRPEMKDYRYQALWQITT